FFKPEEYFVDSKDVVQTLGFQIKTDTLQTEELCMFETQRFEVTTAIQLIETGSRFEMFVEFRDRLNTDPNLVEKYNLTKLESIDLSTSEYRQRKSEFIERILGQ